MARDGREAWARRVDEWKRSGLTAKQFAARHGIKPATLAWWKWKLGRERTRKRTRAASTALAPRRARKTSNALSPRRARSMGPALSPITFVEMPSPLRAAGPEPFEVVLPSGVRIRVPIDFDAVALGRLLDVLDGRG